MVIVIKKGSSAETVLGKYEEMKKDRKRKNLKKLCGTVKITQDPLKLQKVWRDEWR